MLWVGGQIVSRYISDYWNQMCKMFSISEHYSLTAAFGGILMGSGAAQTYSSYLSPQYVLPGTAEAKHLPPLTLVWPCVPSGTAFF